MGFAAAVGFHFIEDSSSDEEFETNCYLVGIDIDIDIVGIDIDIVGIDIDIVGIDIDICNKLFSCWY